VKDAAVRVARRDRFAERVKLGIAFIGGTVLILAFSLALLVFLLLLALRLAVGDGTGDLD
jgi:ABC-type Na+ efflux pump permease subunit